MHEFEKKKLELELKSFAAKNFERPADCENVEQVQFYIRELCLKINAYKERYGYAPEFAYLLLAQYNARQNAMLFREFVRTY